MAGLGLMNRRRAIQSSPTQGDYIKFADAEVLRVLIANGISSDGIGITYEDAEKITTFSTWFRGNTEITSFDELKEFTNVKAIAQDAFYNCTALVSIGSENITSFGAYSFYGCSALEFVDFSSCTSIGESAFQYCPLSGELVLINVTNLRNNTFSNSNFTRIILPNIVTINQNVWQNNTIVEYLELGENITTIGGYSFYRSAALRTIICRATTPPTLGDGNYFTNATIYVPDESVEAYKTATNWSSYASMIYPMSEFGAYEDVTANYEMEVGQAYGQVGGTINFTDDAAYEHTKVAIGDVDYVRVKAPSQASSLVQYVDGNNKILKIAVTDFPSVMTRYDIESVDGATHIYATSATGTLKIWKAVES